MILMLPQEIDKWYPEEVIQLPPKVLQLQLRSKSLLNTMQPDVLTLFGEMYPTDLNKASG